MTQSLLLVAWAYENQVYTSFRYATGYTLPGLYTGNAKLTQLSVNITDTSFELIYRCENCFSWEHEGSTGSSSTSQGYLVLGRASARRGVVGPTCPDTATFGFHDNGFGQWGVGLENAVSEQYSEWASLPGLTVETTCEG
jgi:cellobiose dehydrogenase (acceptor)